MVAIVLPRQVSQVVCVHAPTIATSIHAAKHATLSVIRMSFGNLARMGSFSNSGHRRANTC